MKYFRGLVLVAGFFLVAAAARSDDKESSLKLPGAKGPLYEKVAPLKNGAEVLGADVSDKREPTPRGKYINPEKPPKTRILPTGINFAMVWVLFDKSPDTARITIEVQNEAGKVEFHKSSQYSSDLSTGRATMSFVSDLKEGVLPDGAYQAKLKVGDEVFLVVNWQVGRPPDMSVDAYIEQRLDQFANRNDHLEERLDQVANRVGQPAQPMTQTVVREEGPGGMVLFLYGIFCALWAQNTKRSAWLWFFLGLFFSVITVLVLLVKNAGDQNRFRHEERRLSQGTS